MSTISTGNFPKALRPAMKKWWGDAYNEFPSQWTDLFDKDSSNLSYEELGEVTGFGLVPKKPEGTDSVFDSESQGTITTATHVAYSLGFKVTYEEMKFNKYMVVGKQRTKRLAFSFRNTKETVLANIYNRAHTAGYTFGDGSILCVTSHPTLNGTQSNTLAAAADASETTIEDMWTQVTTAKNSRGLQIGLKPKSIIAPPALIPELNRIVKSTLQNDTANNAINAINAMGMFPEGIKMNQYLTDTDGFFIRTQIPSGSGLICFQAEEATFDQDNDFPSKDMCYRGYELYVGTVGDFRALYSNGGGA
jgi:hypothetical protein